jgi:choline dehydrogenase-like flavoprotein
MIFQDATAYAASGHTPRVCIVGSGPAGMSIALKLAAARVPSVILEAGADDWTEESQDHYRGAVVGDHYFDLDATRLRFMGGSSNHWAGWCRVLDAHDFEPKSYLAHSGWPIRRSDIEPFLDETREVLDLHPFPQDLGVTESFRWFEMQKSQPVRFREKYADLLAGSDLIALVLNTQVDELVGDGSAVRAAKIRSRGLPAGEVTAPHYVVATGGLENARLLLWSNERSNGGVVPHARALGRYWMEHPMFEVGTAFITDAEAMRFDHEGDAFFTPSVEAMAARGVLNFHVQVQSMPYSGVKRFIAETACMVPETTEWVSSKLGLRLSCASRLHMAWEQPPREDNRVALSATERDADGMPRIELHWKKDELDRRTMLEGIRMFGEEFARRDLGRIHISDWVRDGGEWPTDMEIAGNHHMGGTRMGTDTTTSVVDANCKVHGMANLYVGGSSVFATSGQCTPTTTITALALRLGDHLARVAGQVQAKA